MPLFHQSHRRLRGSEKIIFRYVFQPQTVQFGHVIADGFRSVVGDEHRFAAARRDFCKKFFHAGKQTVAEINRAVHIEKIEFFE